MRKRKTYDMSDLPADLVCKRWNALFKEPRFSEKHFQNAPKQSRVIMLKESRLFPMSIDLNVVPPSIEFKDALSLKASSNSDSKQVDIAEVFHCDGLLLCVTKDHKPVVWNPYSGETRWIQHKNGYGKLCRFALGYENNQSCRSYKILMFWNSWYCELYHANNPVGGFEIYEFGSNSWRVVIDPNCVHIDIWYSGVTLKGNSYWISTDNGDDYLLSFDFTRERFRRLCLPPSGRYMALSVFREEQLSVISIGHKWEMWVTKKIDTDAKLSWSKFFAVDLCRLYRYCVFLFTSLLIDEEKKVALCCNSAFQDTKKYCVYTIGEEAKYDTEISCIIDPYGALLWKPFIFNYVPSSVQIQPKIVVSSSQAVPIVSETATFSEGNQFALLDQSDLFEDSFSQTPRGGKQLSETNNGDVRECSSHLSNTISHSASRPERAYQRHATTLSSPFKSLKSCKTIDKLSTFHRLLGKQGLDNDVSSIITKLVARSCESGTHENLSFVREVFDYFSGKW